MSETPAPEYDLRRVQEVGTGTPGRRITRKNGRGDGMEEMPSLWSSMRAYQGLQFYDLWFQGLLEEEVFLLFVLKSTDCKIYLASRSLLTFS